MADSNITSVSGPMGAPDAYGLTGSKVSNVGKLLMGPASKKNKKKAPKLSGANRFPRSMRKGM